MLAKHSLFDYHCSMPQTADEKAFESRPILFVLLVLLSACTPQTVTLVNPKNGDARRCSAAELAAGGDQFIEDTRVKACVHQWRSLGYVETEKLTAEQRARLVSE
jgi:hypothetical protein